jgi:hypothetical protein
VEDGLHPRLKEDGLLAIRIQTRWIPELTDPEDDSQMQSRYSPTTQEEGAITPKDNVINHEEDPSSNRGGDFADHAT